MPEVLDEVIEKTANLTSKERRELIQLLKEQVEEITAKSILRDFNNK